MRFQIVIAFESKMTLTNASHTGTIEKTDPLIFKPRAAGCRLPTFCQAYSRCRTLFLLPSSVGTSVVIKQSMIPCQVLQILKPVLSNWAKNPKHATVPQYQMSGLVFNLCFTYDFSLFLTSFQYTDLSTIFYNV